MFAAIQNLVQFASWLIIGLVVVGSADAFQAESKSRKKSTRSKSEQDADVPVKGVTFSDPTKAKWQVITRIQGGASAATNMLVTIPVPTDWPEQSVAIADEQIPSAISNISTRELNSNVKQIVIKIPRVNRKADYVLAFTFLVTTNKVNAPADTSVFVRPTKKVREGKPYLQAGPQINFRNGKLKKLVKELVADKPDAWSEVESIFDWVRDNIETKTQEPGDVVSAFRAKSGCEEDKVGLFVAMCRAHKIPARMVWVEGSMYAEFMLADANGKAHWFPCNVTGFREFGSTSEPKIILQKGDNIRVPEKEKRQKFVAEFATCSGRTQPSVKFYRQLLPADE